MESEHPGYGQAPAGPARRGVRWPLVVAIAFLVLLVGGAFAAYAYDDSRKDEIANGVIVGGVDVGGLEAREAEELLRHQVLRPLRKPVVVRHRDQRWRLGPRRLKVRTDIEGMVEEAIDASQEGGLPGRMVRYVSGGSIDERIEPRIEHSRSAINRFVRRIAGDIDRGAQDASVSPTSVSLNVISAETGRKLRDNLLEKRLAALVESSSVSRRIVAKVRVTKPQVTTDEVASTYPTYLTLDQSSYTLRFWRNLELVSEYTVAVGQSAYPTPYGSYSIASKQVDPVWSVPNSPWAGELAGTVVGGGTAENPLKARWMGITDGVGIHGTDSTYSLGTAASHGCIRMSVDDVSGLYDQVPIGTPIYIG